MKRKKVIKYSTTVLTYGIISLIVLGSFVFFKFGNKNLSGQVTEIVNCKENWKCKDWNPCISGFKQRLCTDVNECRTRLIMPPIREPCTTSDFINAQSPKIQNPKIQIPREIRQQRVNNLQLKAKPDTAFLYQQILGIIIPTLVILILVSIYLSHRTHQLSIPKIQKLPEKMIPHRLKKPHLSFFFSKTKNTRETIQPFFKRKFAVMEKTGLRQNIIDFFKKPGVEVAPKAFAGKPLPVVKPVVNVEPAESNAFLAFFKRPQKSQINIPVVKQISQQTIRPLVTKPTQDSSFRSYFRKPVTPSLPQKILKPAVKKTETKIPMVDAPRAIPRAKLNVPKKSTKDMIFDDE